jgi:hypothetical protein
MLELCASGAAENGVRLAIYKIQRDVPRSMPSKEYKDFFFTEPGGGGKRERGAGAMLAALSWASGKGFPSKLRAAPQKLRSLNSILLAYCLYDSQVRGVLCVRCLRCLFLVWSSNGPTFF